MTSHRPKILPSYVRAKRLASGETGYFWELPTWARPPAERHGRRCPVRSEALGSDLAEAASKANRLNDAFTEWREGVSFRPEQGTVRWLFGWYREQDRYKDAAEKTRRDYRANMETMQALPMQSGRTFGDLQATAIDADKADALYKRMRVRGERTGAYCMQTCRRVWNEAIRHRRKTGIAANPFAKMKIRTTAANGNRDTARAEYDAFRAKAHEMGYPMLAAAAAIMFELAQSKTDTLALVFDDKLQRGVFWGDYEPGVKFGLRRAKTGNALVIPLADDDGQPLYPTLDAELALLERRGDDEPIIYNLKTGRRYREDEADRDFRKVRDAAKLPKKMTWTGFKHGGMTELGDAGVTDVRPISGHKTLQQTTIYNKANQAKARTAGAARRSHVAKRVGMASE